MTAAAAGARDAPDAMDALGWWLVRIGDQLLFARLRERPAGTAEILNAAGEIVHYDSADSARAALLDADFIAFDGMDDDDATLLGVSLEWLRTQLPDDGLADDSPVLRRAMSPPISAPH